MSIPYLSGHPFLHTAEKGMAEIKELCQSPIYRDTHFYPHPKNCLILCGLPASILQVFIRQFWQRACFWVFNTFVIIFGSFLKMRKIPLARLLHFSDMVTVLNIDSLWLNASGLPCSPVTLIQLSGRIDHHAEPETMSGTLHSLILQCFTKQQIKSHFKEHSMIIILPYF